MLDSALKLTQATGELWRGLERVDFAAARRRAQAMRDRFPDLDVDRVHAALVHAKCLQAGALGTVGASAKLIPGVGGVIAGMLGPLADSTVLSALQAELIAETFALYGVDLPGPAERAAVLAIASTHRGARQAGQTLVQALAQQARKAMGGTLAARAMPLAEVLTAMASQVAVTYAIGMRARALCQLRHARPEELTDLLRAAASIDERRLMAWTHTVAATAIEAGLDAGRRWFARIETLLPDITRFSRPGARDGRQPPVLAGRAAPVRRPPRRASGAGAAKAKAPRAGASGNPVRPSPARSAKTAGTSKAGDTRRGSAAAGRFARATGATPRASKPPRRAGSARRPARHDP